MRMATRPSRSSTPRSLPDNTVPPGEGSSFAPTRLYRAGSRVGAQTINSEGVGVALERFHYTFEDGKKVVLPKFDSIMTVGFARKNRQTEQSELGWLILEKAADEKALEVIDEQALSSFEAFMEAWQKDSGVSVGESSAS